MKFKPFNINTSDMGTIIISTENAFIATVNSIFMPCKFIVVKIFSPHLYTFITTLDILHVHSTTCGVSFSNNLFMAPLYVKINHTPYNDRY